MYVYGGYSKEKSLGGPASAAAAAATHEGRVHEDMWSMNLRALLGSGGAGAGGGRATLDTTKAVWQRVSRKGQFPSSRCGSAAVVYKGKAVAFGGVLDNEGESNQLVYSYSLLYIVFTNPCRTTACAYLCLL